jgi:PAS domain-containing protein
MAVTLILGGAVGAMAFGAVMVFVSRRSDLVACRSGCFLACMCATCCSTAVAGAGGDARHAFPRRVPRRAPPRPWPHRAAIAIAAGGLGRRGAECARLRAGARRLARALGERVSLQLLRERRTSWPLVISVMALTYPLFTLDLLEGPGLDPAGFLAYVVAPGVILTRRAIRAFDAEARRALDQAKFATDVFDSVPVALSMRDTQGRYVFVNRTWEKYYGNQRDG